MMTGSSACQVQTALVPSVYFTVTRMSGGIGIGRARSRLIGSPTIGMEEGALACADAEWLLRGTQDRNRSGVFSQQSLSSVEM
jgi:hypothetical protein